jgi:WD40 repeat protein
VLRGHEDRVANLKFSPDSRHLVTVAYGVQKPVARLWEITADGPTATCVTLPWHHKSRQPQLDVFFSSDSRWLALAEQTRAMLFNVQFEEAVALARLAVGRQLRETELQRFSLSKSKNGLDPSSLMLPAAASARKLANVAEAEK